MGDAERFSLDRAIDQIAACGNLVEHAAFHELNVPPKVMHLLGATIANLALRIHLAMTDGTVVERHPGPP